MTIKFNNKQQIVAINNEKIIGYIDICHPDDYSKNRNLEIKMIYVNPEYRRTGVASNMIEFLFNNFKDIIWVSMWTSMTCEIDKSWSLYEKLGFRQAAYLEDYYCDGIGTRYFYKRII